MSNTEELGLVSARRAAVRRAANRRAAKRRAAAEARRLAFGFWLLNQMGDERIARQARCRRAKPRRAD